MTCSLPVMAMLLMTLPPESPPPPPPPAATAPAAAPPPPAPPAAPPPPPPPPELPPPTKALARSTAFWAAAGIGRGAAQDDIAVDGVDGDAAARNGAVDQPLQGLTVKRHLDVEAEDLAAIGIEEEGVGLPDGFGEEIGGVLGPDHGVDDRGIADQHVARGGGQPNDHGFVEANPDEALVSRDSRRGGERQCGQHQAEDRGRELRDRNEAAPSVPLASVS